MRNFVTHLLVLVLLGLGVMPAVAQSNVPRIEQTACPFPISADLLGDKTLDCGYLDVLENHADPSSPVIQLAFAILHTSSTPPPDPVIYLEGGPGGAGTASLEGIWLQDDLSFLGGRDFIMLDQRGTGYSRPALNCPSTSDNGTTTTTAFVACYHHFMDNGVNLNYYNSAQNAADVADLRVTLGYKEWNLLGISYGTRLALTVMRDHPEGVRSVILDSTVPPEVDRFNVLVPNALRAFQTLFAGCQKDDACNGAYPDLENTFYATVTRLNDQPAHITIPAGPHRKEREFLLTGGSLADVLFQLMYRTSAIPSLPRVLSETAQGNYKGLIDLLYDTNLNNYYMAQEDDNGISEGMYYSVECHEEIPFNNLRIARGLAGQAPLSLQGYFVQSVSSIFENCALWQVDPADPIESQPIVSAIPTLVLAGEYDPITPPAWGKEAARYLSNSHFYQFPGAGHGVINTSACSLSIGGAFISQPDQAPDASCIADLTEPNFEMPMY